MKENKSIIGALKVLPKRIFDEIYSKAYDKLGSVEEVRIRAGKPIVLGLKNGKMLVSDECITREDVVSTLQNATNHSFHTYMESLKNGFLTLEGGHRLGVCGSIIMQNGNTHTIKNFSSINIRVAHEVLGCASKIANQIDVHQNLLIISPPSLGKTTLLRDIIRIMSDRGKKVSVADERMEICGAVEGVSQFDIGENTDFIDHCPKAVSSMIMIKTMSPEILAFDEITSPEDIKAMEYATNCGVSVFATAHGNDETDLINRPLYSNILELFSNVIIIKNYNGARQYIYKKLRS